MKPMKKPLDAKAALMRLESQCAVSELSTFDVKTKLRRWRVAETDITDIVESLVFSGYVDDRRYANAFAHDKIKLCRWGRLKVKLLLSARNIDDRTIEAALSRIDEDEYRQLMLNTLRNRASKLGEPSFENNTKLYRFAVGRGFESSLIASIIRSGLQWQSEED